nr:unnamed protein product [Spirometra erinaceieuropaei]
MTHVTDNRAFSGALFASVNGAKQGCELAPTLSAAILLDAYRDERSGISIGYGNDVQVLNTRRRQASTQTLRKTVHELLVTVVYESNAPTEATMERSMNLFASDRTNYGLAINTDKTMVMGQPSPDTSHNDPRWRRIHESQEAVRRKKMRRSDVLDSYSNPSSETVSGKCSGGTMSIVIIRRSCRTTTCLQQHLYSFLEVAYDATVGLQSVPESLIVVIHSRY